MSQTPYTDSEDSLIESAMESSTAPTTPDGSLSFSPVLHATQILDAFGSNIANTPTPTARNLLATLSFGNSPAVVRNICCVGAGYVGGPTSAVIAYQNPAITVNVVDRDPGRIASWNSKHLPIHENGLSDIVRIARDGSKSCNFANGPVPGHNEAFGSESDEQREEIAIPAREPNLFFSTEVSKCVAEADIILVTVNTPTKIRGIGAGSATDMTALEGVTREIAIHAKPGAILVEKSTVPCGTAELIKEVLQTHRPDVPFEILSNPEFLAEGTAVTDLLNPDRVIIGSADTASGRKAAETLASVYAAWVPRAKITTINVWSSELSKLVANAMLAQRISSINSISAICEKTGADIAEIATSVGLDPRIGPKYLQSGLGFGGSCFKKDILNLIYLSKSLGLPEVGEYWQQVLTLNDFQRNRFARHVITRLNNTLVRKKVTLLGYAFKKNTGDTREAPAVDIIKTLLAEGPQEIAIFDPCCDPAAVKAEVFRLCGVDEGVKVYTDAYEACRDSNAVVIVTEWDEFRNSPAPATKQQKRHKKSADPRPFPENPSESDLLALYKYAPHTLDRYVMQPECEDDCTECVRLGAAYSKAGEQLDWALVAKELKEPKWVFDGRGIMEISGLEKLGIRAETIGKAPSRMSR